MVTTLLRYFCSRTNKIIHETIYENVVLIAPKSISHCTSNIKSSDSCKPQFWISPLSSVICIYGLVNKYVISKDVVIVDGRSKEVLKNISKLMG